VPGEPHCLRRRGDPGAVVPDRASGGSGARLPAGPGYEVRDLRVRDLGDTARLELDAAAVDHARGNTDVLAAIQAAGFGKMRVCVQAFRSGSMNDLPDDPQRWRDV